MKFYQKTWFIVLMMICLPPLGWLLMFKCTDWSVKTKKVLSIPLGIYTLFFAISCVMSAVNPPATTTGTPPASISSSSELGKPAESSKPSEISNPVEGSKSSESSKPVESSKAVESSKPLESSKPVESSAPASSSESPAIVAPVEREKPAKIESPASVASVEIQNPTKSSTPAQSDNSTPAESVKEPDKQDQTVYYTKTGKKYHYENPCGNGTYYPCTLDEAIEKGLTPCEKCIN